MDVEVVPTSTAGTAGHSGSRTTNLSSQTLIDVQRPIDKGVELGVQAGGGI